MFSLERYACIVCMIVFRSIFCVFPCRHQDIEWHALLHDRDQDGQGFWTGSDIDQMIRNEVVM